MFKNISMGLILFLMTIALADRPMAQDALLRGNDSGNGGHVIVCDDTTIRQKTYEILDLYEARNQYGLRPDYGPKGLNAMAKVHYVLDRFGKFDSGRSDRYRRDAEEYMKEAKFLTGVTLNVVNDFSLLSIPENCTVEQIAIQQHQQFPPRPRYIINKKLWDKLDETNKAALILHEIIYKEGIENEHTDSVLSRYFHELIAANDLSAFGKTPEEYARIQRDKFNFHHFYWGPFWFENSSKWVFSHKVKFDENGIVSGLLWDYQCFSFSKLEWCAPHYGNPEHPDVTFYGGSKPVVKTFFHDPFLGGLQQIPIGFKKVSSYDKTPLEIKFSEAGQILVVDSAVIQIQGQLLNVYNLTFDPGINQLKMVSQTYPSVNLKTTKGAIKEIHFNEFFSLDKDDLIVD